ncbi:MerR family transcriptional regulator [Streptomyces sp. SDr-06]|uniref:MerR family transcriptional regulator n=1 Tax=Streptomyces sp. SDr-06 TaxID=2267702 RepID=UPI000DE8948F|nr:MerR family transcriptional regulator [Streptomyces sp. SDr-06]RCH70197.1 MerR family transcriptional regulator [Streptomyces sp. SDr-06]
MLIGELAERTATSERLLRYYERMGLLTPQRRPNGYRVYDADTEDSVTRIRALLAAGLPTRVIRQVLPCTTPSAAVMPCPGVLASLRRQLSALDERAAQIAAAREILVGTIAATEQASAASGAHPVPPRELDEGGAGAPSTEGPAAKPV